VQILRYAAHIFGRPPWMTENAQESGKCEEEIAIFV